MTPSFGVAMWTGVDVLSPTDVLRLLAYIRGERWRERFARGKSVGVWEVSIPSGFHFVGWSDVTQSKVRW